MTGECVLLIELWRKVEMRTAPIHCIVLLQPVGFSKDVRHTSPTQPSQSGRKRVLLPFIHTVEILGGTYCLCDLCAGGSSGALDGNEGG